MNISKFMEAAVKHVSENSGKLHKLERPDPRFNLDGAKELMDKAAVGALKFTMGAVVKLFNPLIY